MAYPNGYQPTEAKPEVRLEVNPPKCISAEDGIIAADKTNKELLDELYDENAKLRKKLKKARKEKKRWKRKYLAIRDAANNLKDYVEKSGNVATDR